ncbi:hypothetical protein [Oxalicibacterium faecigallinarum]|uniref:Uncharacterized protein n=1 Tax=Oxalicibacterium faecigallinarum TaxID=573741 RepID=A0A8J3F4L4_9BURK|nr:hypothetical protein [Oxalicibacterium faecigallinarum]GGI16881.1 hypothetical protein GCM10008066_06180 [Oxalicibacterium faecigallinarum]
MNQILEYAIGRARHPSAWAGLAALGVLVGVSPEKVNLLVQVGTYVAGVAAVFLPSPNTPK